MKVKIQQTPKNRVDITPVFFTLIFWDKYPERNPPKIVPTPKKIRTIEKLN